MMCSVSVLFCLDTDDNIVKAADCGVSPSNLSVDSIYNAVVNYMKLPDADRKKMGERGKAYVVKNHNYTDLAKKLLQNI